MNRISEFRFYQAAHAVGKAAAQHEKTGRRRKHLRNYKKAARRHLGLQRVHSAHWQKVLDIAVQMKWIEIDRTSLSYPILVPLMREHDEAHPAHSDADGLLPAAHPVHSTNADPFTVAASWLVVRQKQENTDDEDTADEPTVHAAEGEDVWGLLVSYPCDHREYVIHGPGQRLYLGAWFTYEEIDQAERLAIKDNVDSIVRIRKDA